MVSDYKIYEPIIWPYRLIGNLLLLGMVWIIAFGVITIRQNLVSKQVDSLLSEIYNKTASIGWGLNDITIEGREKTAKQELLDVINLKRGDNILEIDLDDLNERLLTLPWIKEVAITRSYFPNVLHISIKEKEVKAIWQYQNNFYPLDEEGKIIETEYVPQKNLLQIIGKGAPEHFNELLEIIEQDEELFSRLKAANFISERRWDLIFDDVENGITVKMPEDDLAEAWKKLIKMDKTKGILKRKLTFIDLRLKNRVVVRLNTSEDKSEKQ